MPQIGEYAELGAVTREMVDNQETEFTNEVKARAEANGGKVKYVDCTKVEHEVEAKEVSSQKTVIKGLQSKYPGEMVDSHLFPTQDKLFKALCVRFEVPPAARV